MIGSRASSVLPQLYPTELLQRCAPPVCRGSRRFQSAFAFSTILVTQHPNLSPSVSAQSMWTKQSRQPFIDSLDRTFVRYRRPDQLINILNCLNVRSDDTHLSFQISRQISRPGKLNKPQTLQHSNTRTAARNRSAKRYRRRPRRRGCRPRHPARCGCDRAAPPRRS